MVRHVIEARRAETTGDFLVRRLSEWGVKRVYGYPGDGINGIMGVQEMFDSFKH